MAFKFSLVSDTLYIFQINDVFINEYLQGFNVVIIFMIQTTLSYFI